MLSRNESEPQRAAEPAAGAKSDSNSFEGNRPLQKLEQNFSYSLQPPAPAAASPTRTSDERSSPGKQERKLFICEGISFRGEILGCDHLVIAGSIEAAVDDCRKIEIAEAGRFKGSAAVAEAAIAGLCDGTLHVRHKLFIGRAGRVLGSVEYGKLEVEEGGEINADIRCVKHEPAPDSDIEDRAEPPAATAPPLCEVVEQDDVGDNADTGLNARAEPAEVDRTATPVAEIAIIEPPALVVETSSPVVDIPLPAVDIPSPVVDAPSSPVADAESDTDDDADPIDAAEIERMFASAMATRDLSRFEEAEAMLKAVLAKAPRHVGALAALGKLARQRGDRAGALRYIEAAAAADPQNAWLRCDAATLLHELSRSAEAEAMLKSVLANHPKHVGALTGLGQLARERGDRAAALGYFERATAADPENPWVRCDAANLLRELSRLDEAEKIFKSVLETHPRHIGALTGLGRLSRQRRDRAGALAYFEAAVAADPKNIWVRCDLANILRELSRTDEAAALLKAVLEDDPQHVGALTGLGHLARQSGDPKGALKYFEAASKADPRNPDVRCELATVLRELSRTEEAETVYKSVIEAHPKHVAALTGLGHLARQREDRTAAMRWFESAMAAAPDDMAIRVEFARALRQQGEFAKARQVMEKILNEEAMASDD